MAREDLGRFIAERLDELRIGKAELARRTGLSRQALYKLLAGEVEEARVSTFLKLACALESHPLELMRCLLIGSGLVVENRALPRRGRKPDLTPPPRGIYPGDSSAFVADVTFSDNSLVMIGSEFDKTWKIINNGTVAWEGRRLACVDELLRLSRAAPAECAFDEPRPTGLLPLRTEVPIPPTLPGQAVSLTARFRAPQVPGGYISHWKMLDAAGEVCFPHLQGLSCQVNVVFM